MFDCHKWTDKYSFKEIQLVYLVVKTKRYKVNQVMHRLSAKLFQRAVTCKKTMAFDTSRLVSGTSLRWIYDGQYAPTDFLVYLLAVDEKGRTVRTVERRGMQDEGRRWEDRTEGTLRRFRPP